MNIEDRYIDEGYRLVWHDEFDGENLNTDDWNVEEHESGWVNAELQSYPPLENGNIKLKDSMLVIKPHIERVNTDGTRQITSGRISTQGKHDFTYGRFEARAKVPKGKGYLPAFWLMATDEDKHGQWPKCGEIDIMEVMGHDTSASYHTIHYGYDMGSGHRESQGAKQLSDDAFSEEFHVFRLDWEEGKLTWFVDDEEVYSTSEWYAGTDAEHVYPYPAPFNHDFYVILNLAVGGSWVGYPDEEVYVHMEEDSFEIDYVRVYQK